MTFRSDCASIRLMAFVAAMGMLLPAHASAGGIECGCSSAVDEASTCATDDSGCCCQPAVKEEASCCCPTAPIRCGDDSEVPDHGCSGCECGCSPDSEPVPKAFPESRIVVRTVSTPVSLALVKSASGSSDLASLNVFWARPPPQVCAWHCVWLN